MRVTITIHADLPNDTTDDQLTMIASAAHAQVAEPVIGWDESSNPVETTAENVTTVVMVGSRLVTVER